MRRAPIVFASTAAGLGLVLTFHTSQPSGTLAVGPGARQAGPSTTTTAPPPAGPAPNPGGSPSTTATPPTSAAATRSATGTYIPYRYGDIELKVTAQGSRILSINVLKEGSTDPRSAEINSQAVPILTREVMDAQSSNIDGVSGATFTSEAYYESLTSALSQLGIK